MIVEYVKGHHAPAPPHSDDNLTCWCRPKVTHLGEGVYSVEHHAFDN